MSLSSSIFARSAWERLASAADFALASSLLAFCISCIMLTVIEACSPCAFIFSLDSSDTSLFCELEAEEWSDKLATAGRADYEARLFASSKLSMQGVKPS